MSRIPVARPIPIGLLATGPGTTSPPTNAKSLGSWLRSAAIVSAFGMFALASAGLTAAGFRPVSQRVSETAFPPVADTASEVEPSPPTIASNVEETLEYIDPGEARPSLTNPRVASSHPATVELAKSEPIAVPKRMRQSQTNQCGTAIDFVRSQSIAFDRAAREQKLVMVLHVAGNFEDPGFT